MSQQTLEELQRLQDEYEANGRVESKAEPTRAQDLSTMQRVWEMNQGMHGRKQSVTAKVSGLLLRGISTAEKVVGRAKQKSATSPVDYPWGDVRKPNIGAITGAVGDAAGAVGGQLQKGIENIVGELKTGPPPGMENIGEQAVPLRPQWKEPYEKLKWVKDTLATAQRHYSEMPEDQLAQMLTKDYWLEVGPKAFDAVGEFVRGASEKIGLDYGKMLPPEEKSVMYEKPRQSLEQILNAKGQEAEQFLEYLPMAAMEFMSDPDEFIKERPLDAAFVLAMTVPFLKTAAKGGESGVFGEALGLSVKKVGKQPKQKLKLKTTLEAATDAVARGEVKLSETYPNAAGDVVKTKQGGTTIVRDFEAAELMDRSVKDMGLSILTPEAIRSAPFVSRTFKPFQRLMEEYGIKDRAFIREYKNLHETAVYRWKETLKKAKVSKSVASERIARYLTGIQEGGETIINAMGKKVLKQSEMTPVELQIIEEARLIYDKFFERLNHVRKQSGKKPLNYEKNYFTWMRNADALTDMGMSLGDTPVGDLNQHMTGTNFRWATRRKKYMGQTIDVPVELDFFGVFDKYAHDALQHIHITPVVAKGRAYLEPFDVPVEGVNKSWQLSMDKPKMASYMNEWLDAIAGKRQISDVAWKRGFQVAASKLNKNLAASILSYNIRSALIQPSALRGVYSKVGGHYLSEGIRLSLTKEGYDFVTKHSNLEGRTYDIHAAQISPGGITGKTKTGRKLSGVKRKTSELGIKPLQILDMASARIAWRSYYEWGIRNQKLSHPEAVKVANQGILTTQASAKIGHLSPIQRSAGGRLATVFNTFPINDWNMVMSDVMGIKNPSARRIPDAIRFLVATEAVNALTEGAFNIQSPFPAPEWDIYEGIKEGKPATEIIMGAAEEVLESVPVVGGTLRWSTDYRTAWPAPIQMLGDLQRTGRHISEFVIDAAVSLAKEGKPTFDFSKVSMYDLETIGKLLGVPGSTQVRKYISRRKRGMSHVESLVGMKPEYEPQGPQKKYTKGSNSKYTKKY